MPLKIGILREEKLPADKRCALSPAQAAEVHKHFNVEVLVQKSKERVFSESEFIQNGIKCVESVEQCDILLGVKEVPPTLLIEGKTYLFFSHTIKEQAHNRQLLQEVLKKKITLIDYECLVDPATQQRLIAFGRFAGIVGAYNTIWTFGKRYNLFDLKRAHECYDLLELKSEFSKVKLPAIKIVITGGGRVAKGAMEVLFGMGIKKVSPYQFLNENFTIPVFTQLNSHHYHSHKSGKDFNREDFHSNPGNYRSEFRKYTKESDILIATAFWDPRGPVLFKKDDILEEDFKITVIGDISCDIDGSIPSTIKSSTIQDPIYDYNQEEDSVEPPLSVESNLTVMAIDNLPCELPRDASESFGRELIDRVLPHLLQEKNSTIIEKATIAKDGKLTEDYKYLQSFVDQDKDFDA